MKPIVILILKKGFEPKLVKPLFFDIIERLKRYKEEKYYEIYINNYTNQFDFL